MNGAGLARRVERDQRPPRTPDRDDEEDPRPEHVNRVWAFGAGCGIPSRPCMRLTGLDAAFLALETPAAHMQVIGVAVVDPSTIDAPAEGPFYERVRDAARSAAASRAAAAAPPRRGAVQPERAVVDRRSRLRPRLSRAPRRAPRAGRTRGAGRVRRPMSRAGRSIAATRCGRRTSSRASSTDTRRSSPRCTTRLIDGVAGVEVIAALFDLEPERAADAAVAARARVASRPRSERRRDARRRGRRARAAARRKVIRAVTQPRPGCRPRHSTGARAKRSTLRCR